MLYIAQVIHNTFFYRRVPMQQYNRFILLHIVSLMFTSLNSMEKPQEKGPMDSVWFYDKHNPFMLANQYHQCCLWKNAEAEYLALLEENAYQKFLSYYDKNKAFLNVAACLMAQRKATPYWRNFDLLLSIPSSKRLSDKILNTLPFNKAKKTVLVRTDQIGIGDIFHFFSVTEDVKINTPWDVIVSVPNFLKDTLASAAQAYDLQLVAAEDEQPITDYETHLISLLGHFNLQPHCMNPSKVVFTAPERAMNAVKQQLTPLLKEHVIVAVFLGGSHQTTLIGGKQLPHNTKHHGRHLDSAPFGSLLEKYPHIILLDCNGQNNKIVIQDMYKNRLLSLAQEEQPFDTIIALGHFMSGKRKVIAFGADTESAHVFARSLDHFAQNRMAFIIPNSKEYDMRMEGKGSKYKQMLSHCWVYKCKEPTDQTKVIKKAYLDMKPY